MSSLKILINALQFLEICIVSHTRLWKTHVASPRKGNIQWIPVKKLIKQNFWLGMLQNRKFHAVLHTLGLEKKIIFVFLAFCDLLCSWSSHPIYAVNFSTTALPRHFFSALQLLPSKAFHKQLCWHLWVLPCAAPHWVSTQLCQDVSVFTYKQLLISCIFTRSGGKKREKDESSFPANLLWVAAQANKDRNKG